MCSNKKRKAWRCPVSDNDYSQAQPKAAKPYFEYSQMLNSSKLGNFSIVCLAYSYNHGTLNNNKITPKSQCSVTTKVCLCCHHGLLMVGGLTLFVSSFHWKRD